MKVLHINSNYLTSKLHENLIDRLEKMGITNDIYMPMKKAMQEEILYESKNSVYNPVAFYDIDKYFFSWKQYKIFKELNKSYTPGNYDRVHAHTLFTDGNIALKLKNKYNIPYVVTVRGRTDLDFFKKRPNLRNRGRSILKNASRIVFLSENDKNEMFSKYFKNESKKLEEKISVIPNGIDAFWFDNEGTPKSIRGQKTMNFIFAGRMIKSKNIPFSVKVLNVYAEKNNLAIKLTIVGKQENRKILQEVKETSEIELALIDNVDRDRLIELYRSNDIFIMPSYPETFGLVYAEAMSQGLPVIYSNKSGFNDQFKEGVVGYGVDHEDINDTCNKIEKLVTDYETISKNCIDKYKKFDWDTITRKYKNIYENLT